MQNGLCTDYGWDKTWDSPLDKRWILMNDPLKRDSRGGVNSSSVMTVKKKRFWNKQIYLQQIVWEHCTNKWGEAEEKLIFYNLWFTVIYRLLPPPRVLVTFIHSLTPRGKNGVNFPRTGLFSPLTVQKSSAQPDVISTWYRSTTTRLFLSFF